MSDLGERLEVAWAALWRFRDSLVADWAALTTGQRQTAVLAVTLGALLLTYGSPRSGSALPAGASGAAIGSYAPRPGGPAPPATATGALGVGGALTPTSSFVPPTAVPEPAGTSGAPPGLGFEASTLASAAASRRPATSSSGSTGAASPGSSPGAVNAPCALVQTVSAQSEDLIAQVSGVPLDVFSALESALGCVPTTTGSPMLGSWAQVPLVLWDQGWASQADASPLPRAGGPASP